MANIYLNDRTLTIESAYSCAQIKEVAQASGEEATTLTRGEAHEVYFRVAAGMGKPSVSSYGINFAGDSLQGKAKITADVPGGTQSEVINNAFTIVGEAYDRLKSVEEEIAAFIARRNNLQAAFAAELIGADVESDLDESESEG